MESCVAIEDDDRFLTSVIVESILGVRVTNAKCRTSSFELFNVLAEKFQHDEQQFKKFLDMIKAGLGGTPFYRSATILVLTSILYNYSGVYNELLIIIILHILFYLNFNELLCKQTCHV